MKLIEKKIQEQQEKVNDLHFAKFYMNKVASVIMREHVIDPTIKVNNKKPENLIHIQIAIALCKNKLIASDDIIGDFFNKSRCIVISSTNMINNRVMVDKLFREAYNKLNKLIN